MSRLVFVYLSLIGFFGIFSTTISKSPVLPLYVHALGGSDSLLGLIAALSPLAGILFGFPVGYFADRIGYKKLLRIAAGVFVIAPLFYILVGNPWMLLPVRFFHGIATAILGPVAAIIIVSHYPTSKGEKMGLYTTVTLLGRTIAPLLGGLIISSSASQNFLNFRMVYVVAFLLSIPILVLSFLYKGEKQHASSVEKKAGFFESLRYFSGNKKLLATALIHTATYFSYGVLETFLPRWSSMKQIAASEIGLLFSIQILAIALSQPLFGKIADKIDKRWQIIGGISILLLAMLMIPLMSSYLFLLADSLLFGLGMSFLTIATNTYVAEVTGMKKLGSSLGALSSFMDIGHTFGPLLVGMIITSFSMQFGFLFCAVLSASALTYFVVATRGKRVI